MNSFPHRLWTWLLCISVIGLLMAAAKVLFIGRLESHAFEGAVEGDDLPRAKSMLENKPDLASGKDSHGGIPPIVLAADRGDTAMVELLLKNKADVNAKARFGETALQRAALKGNEDLI